MTPSTPFYAREGLHTALYDAMHEAYLGESSVAGDAAWYAARAREWGGPVLEGGVGTGRVALEIARAGVEVVGFDRSEGMLRVAEAKRALEPPAVAARVTLLRAGFLDFDLRRTFPLALVPFRAFQSLLDPVEQAAALARFRDHLAPGGRLVIDLFDPRYEFLLPGSLPQRERTGLRHPVRGTEVRVEILSRDLDPVAQVFREEWRFRELDAGGRVLLEESEVLAMRWSFRWEMRHLFARTGLEVEAEWSDFRGSPPAYGKEQVWVLRRA
ncbi:MAG: class I SAM-dependent methyltransferase [Planctomycetaceae bacterium]|nr:class I SAM-dependent methyltransferase [Planctomycetota bacterium]NUN53353.1 class I SAM-dependent methyltransferase [Planctomycetaceae bacterium]